eukprot:Gb_21927 [translate_table: standard]
MMKHLCNGLTAFGELHCSREMNDFTVECHRATKNVCGCSLCCRKPSLEKEPRTLNEGEMHDAREVAADIIRSNMPEEAFVIFTKGLRPVRSVQEMEIVLQNQRQTQKLVLKSQSIHMLCQTNIVEGDSLCLLGASSAPF